MIPATIGSILFGLAILILLFLFLIRPFIKASPETETISKRQELTGKKEAVLEAIRILDFDHDTGKMPDKEYEQQRSALMTEAVATLKALDQLPATSANDDVYAQIEMAVSRIKAQRAQTMDSPAQFCTNCGQALESNDNFCARCGHPVYAVQPTT
jgi:rRNA maturation endonuclease Nob1